MKHYKKFKVFPIKGEKSFYHVVVFEERAAMRMASANMYEIGSLDSPSHRAEAVTHSFKAKKKVKGKWVKSDCIGVVMFYKKGVSHGVVAHEFAHATNYVFLKARIPFKLHQRNKDWADMDEIYATCNEYMIEQFWKKYGKIAR